jgi:FixJ family two-component response regulator
VSVSKRGGKPRLLTNREFQVLEAVKKRDGVRFLAAQDLDITEHAVESSISRIRSKLESAADVRRRYKDILERQR